MEKKEPGDIFSRPVRAGKRTYFFDVKATRSNEYYLTITESKKKFQENGTPFYEKHKIFLYKEDFDKFFDGLNEAVQFIRDKQGNYVAPAHHQSNSGAAGEPSGGNSFSDISFDDLGK